MTLATVATSITDAAIFDHTDADRERLRKMRTSARRERKLSDNSRRRAARNGAAR